MRWPSLGIGLVGMAVYLLVNFQVIHFKGEVAGEPLGKLIDGPIESLASWALILAFLGKCPARQHQQRRPHNQRDAL